MLNMFLCNSGVPSRVDNQRWLYVSSSNRGIKRESAEESSNKNSQVVSSTSSQDSFDQAPKTISHQKALKTVEKSSHNVSNGSSQEAINQVNQNNSSHCSQEAINQVNQNNSSQYSQKPINQVNQYDSSQYSQETINKIFDETSSQFSQDTMHKASQDASIQYSQETISKIFEDDSFETFDDTSSNASGGSDSVALSSRPIKRHCASVEPKDDDASVVASLQISPETLGKIFEDYSFEPSGNPETTSESGLVDHNANSDDSFDSGDYDESSSDSEYATIPRLKLKTKCTIGKWLLFNDTEVDPIDNLSPHDRAWDKIKSIVTDPRNIDIISAKCSTNYSLPGCGYWSSRGVICCYTGDYRDKLSVKRAADAIRNALWFTCCIYYKTDDATSAGAYQHLGDTAISMYMHTNGNKMYERDVNGKWTIAKF